VLGALDFAVLRAFRTRGHTRERERAVAAFSKLGEQAIIWYAICGIGWVVDADHRPTYAKTAKTVLGVYAFNQLVKFSVRRPRPRLEGLPPLSGTLSGLAYPSAHSASSFAAARTLSSVLPAAPLYTLAVALGLSRLYLGLHYPSDILAGAALGGAGAELAS
jgi:undecaprenyl-diphosphatase